LDLSAKGIQFDKFYQKGFPMKQILSLVIALGLFASSALAKEYVVDTSHSDVEFSVKHMMISTVKGSFGDYKADIAFDPKTKTFTEVKATIEAESIDTANEKRDNHLRSADFFEVAAYPTMTFTMSSYDAKSGAMKGELTIKDITKPVTLQTTVNGIITDMQGSERVGFTLNGTIDRKDFGLTWNKALEAGGLLVGDEVTMNIEIQMIEL
jgi:polyisoprenoid-binding protein YceI